ncbi:MAG: hypothetical protein ACK5G7_05640, partial [Erysipelotrichaceae bacterium]
MFKVDVLVEYGVLTQSFSYLSKAELLPYTRVKIEFKNQIIIGLVLSCTTDLTSDFQLKEIIEIIDHTSILDQEMIALVHFMEQEYLCSKMRVIQTLLPAALRPQSNSFKPIKIVYVKLLKCSDVNTDKRQKALDYLQEHNTVTRAEFNKLFPGVLKYFVENDLVELIE